MSQADWDKASAAALALFAFGQQEAAQRGLLLVDTKYELGKDAEGNILLLDEVRGSRVTVMCDSSVTGGLWVLKRWLWIHCVLKLHCVIEDGGRILFGQGCCLQSVLLLCVWLRAACSWRCDSFRCVLLV
jgi:hypothetical protein